MTDKLKDIRRTLLASRWTLALMSRANVFLVGGVVRDSILEKPIKDVDLVVEGLSFNEIKELLTPFGKVSIHGESFSVLVFAPFGHEGEPFEIATPRMDRKIGEGHKGFEIITEGVTIEEDLKRRDFTINSIAMNLKTGEILDPHCGICDLIDGILRATDLKAFSEDPLRILRGIQFASRFGFVISDETLKLMQENAHLIEQITGERILDEFIKITQKKGDTKIAIELLHSTGVDFHLFGRSAELFAMGNLDEISFFFLLGLITDEDPHKFLKRRFKADNDLVKNVEVLDKILGELQFGMEPEDEELRMILSKCFTRAPEVMDAVILPQRVKEVIDLMRVKAIPMNFGDLPITGEDIMEITGFKPGPEIGKIQRRILEDALMLKFNWKDRDAGIKEIIKNSSQWFLK